MGMEVIGLLGRMLVAAAIVAGAAELIFRLIRLVTMAGADPHGEPFGDVPRVPEQSSKER